MDLETIEREVRACRDELEIAHAQNTGGSAAWEVAKRLTALLYVMRETGSETSATTAAHGTCEHCTPGQDCAVCGRKAA